MNILDIVFPRGNLLTEANILNVKDPHDGESIQKYLKHYAKSIKTASAKKMFIKKIQKFLLNDPKYHFAVRELPNDAPDWAHEAMAKKDLFFFKANPDLNSAIEHITHYIAKMEEDMEQTVDNDKKVVATKEFAAFAKAENFEMLEQKSEEYFARGAKDSTDMEGMKEIYHTDSFAWYKLETAEAFKRAGGTLQNCIGDYWTKAKCDSQGTSILVLIDNKGAMIVAARILNKKNELQEMKGKNNKPPIKAYMPPVAAMINKFKLSLSSGAHRDVIKTGYFFDEESRILLTKPQAIKKLVTAKVIGKLDFGLTLVQPEPKNSGEAAENIFSELYWGSAYSDMSRRNVFEARMANGNPIIVAVTDTRDKEIEKINTYFSERLHDETHLQEAVSEQKRRDYFKSFVNALGKLGHVKGFGNSIIRHIFWEIGLEWDDLTKQLKNRSEGTEHTTDKKHHAWKKFVDKSTIDTILQTLSLEHRRRFQPPYTKIFVTKEDEASDRSRNDEDIYLVVIVNKIGNSYLTNISGSEIDEDHIGFKKEIDTSGYGSNVTREGIDNKSIESLVALAKSENFKLPAPAANRFGVMGEKAENYKRFKADWKKLPGDPESIKADFSDLRDGDRFTAMYTTAMGELGGLDNKDLFGIHKNMQKGKKTRYHYYHHDNNSNHSDAWVDHDSEKTYKKLGSIDSIYKVDVGYGAGQRHGVMLLVSKDKIVKVDKNTEEHKWQGWDDFDEVAKILNQFAENHNLTFNTDSVTTDKRSSKEFRAADGKLTTMQKVKSAELSRHKKKEGVDELKFEDNWTLHRMTPDEQGKWIRRGIGDGVRGQAWLLKDEKDNKRAIFTILHQRIARMFYHRDQSLTTEWPTSYGDRVNTFMPYLKAAMDTFGWKSSKTGTMASKAIPNSTVHVLRTLYDYPKGGDKSVKDHEHMLRFWQMDPLVKTGLLHKFKSGPNQGGARRWQITELGKDFLDIYDKARVEGKEHEMTDDDMVQAQKIHKDFKKPEKNAPRPAATRGTRTPRVAGAGTKSAQALVKFTDHVAEHGQIPTRGEFIAYMEEDPFNMSKTGAQTYYYTTKKKYAAANESVLGNLSALLLVEPDTTFNSFADLIIE